MAVVILAGTIPFLLGESPQEPSRGTDVGRQPTTTGLAGFDVSKLAAGEGSGKLPSPYPVEAAQTALAHNQRLLATSAVPPSPIGNVPAVSLPDALRFDVTPAWVRSIWSRVTPQRLETGWYALRVPLVTGTEPADVAGSLTYYFNRQDFVERITLTGLTDDPELLSSLVQQYYALRPYAVTGRGLWLSFYQDVPIGMLRIEDAALLRPGQPQSRYRIELELNLPRPGATLSPTALQPLQRLREAKLL
jgi:hypothetical protein